MTFYSNSTHTLSLLPVIDELISRGVPQNSIEVIFRRNLTDLRTPFMRIPMFLSRRLWDFSVNQTEDNLVGLAAGERFVSTSTNGLTYLFDVALSLEKSCEYFARYFPCLNGHFQINIVHTKNSVEIQFHDCGSIRATPEMIDYILVSMCHMLRRKCNASSISKDPIFTVKLTQARPLNILTYQKVFRTEVEWSQKFDTIELDPEIFFKELTPYNHKIEKIITEMLDETLNKREPTLLELVSDYITNNISNANWQDFCLSLHILERTATRRLKALGWSFSELLDEYRRYRAHDMLLLTNQSLAEVAYQLGYRDVQSLHRSSLRWFGATPGTYRSRSAKPPCEA